MCSCTKIFDYLGVATAAGACLGEAKTFQIGREEEARTAELRWQGDLGRSGGRQVCWDSYSTAWQADRDRLGHRGQQGFLVNFC